VPKGLKEIRKALETGTGTNRQETQYIKDIDFLKESIQHIQKKTIIEEKLNEMFRAKKAITKDLPSIIKESKALQAEVDEARKNREVTHSNLEDLDKQLDRLNEKRKKDQDEIDKLRKTKNELQDAYYSKMIEFTKYQYLVHDVKWMNEKKAELMENQLAFEKRKAEREERALKIKLEREERKRQEEERKERIEAKKQKEIENKKKMEESLRETEIENVDRLTEALNDETVGTNPMFEHIEQCESLKKYCQKQIKSGKEEEVQNQEKKEEKKQANDIDKALAKGSIALAPSKEAKLAGSVFNNLMSKKGKKNTKKNQNDNTEGQIDFGIVKRFNNLKITVPMKEEDYEKTIKDLDDLKNALVYWGKIIQRQNIIKYIKSARKISSDEHYTEIAEKEEKFIQAEKDKYSSEDTAAHEINSEKLKIA